MKKYITKEDLRTLTDSQKQHLRDFWLPEKYDLAVAYICKNAETEEFEEIEFVAGKVTVINTRFVLSDLRYLTEENQQDDQQDEDDNPHNSNHNTSNEDDLYHEESANAYWSDNTEEDGENHEEDYNESYVEYDLFDESDFVYDRPTTFLIEDCLPLLNLGQMIEILDRNNYKTIDFYLLADNGESGCELGNKAFNLSGYGSDFESQELCDVLWNCIKAIL